MMVSWRYWVGVATLLVGCTCFAQDRPRAEAHEGDWLSYGRTADEQRFSPLTQINHRTIAELGLAWSLDLERGARSLEATPLAVDGTLYFTTSLSILYAVDGESGKQLWRYDPQSWKFNARACGQFRATTGASLILMGGSFLARQTDG